MRRKEQKLVIAFHTTADAMAFESACKAEGMPGRLIPVPREITAGCGMAWCADENARECLVSFAARHGIEAEGVHVCLV